MRLFTSELVKKYKARTVVDHVSIDVNQGEIVGPAGAQRRRQDHDVLHDRRD